MIPSKLLDSIKAQARKLELLALLATLLGTIVGCKKDGDTLSGSLESFTLTVDTAYVTEHSVKVHWTRSNAENFQRYEIHFSINSNFLASDTTRYALIPNREATEIVVAPLEAATTYHFKARILTHDGNVIASNEASARTKNPGGLVPFSSLVRFVHAARRLPTVEVSVDSVMKEILSFENAALYRTYGSGTRLVAISHSGITIYTAPVIFLSNAKATVFILDDPTIPSPYFNFLAERSISGPPTSPSNAIVRFVNASLGLDTASLRVGSPIDTTIGDNIVYGTASAYSFLTPASLTLYLTSDTTLVIPPVTVLVSNNRRYTAVALDSMPAPRLKLIVDD